MYYITEYKKNAINKLIPYLLEFPQIVKITEMNASRYQYIEDILWNIANNFKVNNARGSFLDIIAHNEGTNIVYTDTVKVQDAFTYGSTWNIENPDSEEKNPQIYGTGKYYSDTTYLYNTEINVSEEQTIKAIKAQIIKNNTNGEAEDFIEAIKLYFNIDKVQILESYPLGISLVIGGNNLRISGTNNKEIIKTFLPICVSLNNLYLNDKTYNIYQLGGDTSYGTSRYPREISELVSSYTYLSPSIRLKPEDNEYIVTNNNSIPNNSFCCISGILNSITEESCILSSSNSNSNVSLIVKDGLFAINYNGEIFKSEIEAKINNKYTIILANMDNCFKLWLSNKIDVKSDYNRDTAYIKNNILNALPLIDIKNFVPPIDAPVYINCTNKNGTNSNFCDFTYYAILIGDIKENNDIALNEYYTSCFGEKQILFNCLKNNNHLKIHTENNLEKDFVVLQPDFTYNKTHRNSQCAYFDGKSYISYNTEIGDNITKQIKELDLSFKMCIPFENRSSRIIAMFAGSSWSCLSFDKNSNLMLGLGSNNYILSPIELNKFYNIKITIKDNVIKVYLDNMEILSESLDGVELYGSENISLGSENFNGFIKDLYYKAKYNDNTIINLESDLTTTLRDDKNNITYTNEGVRLITTPQLINDITNLDLYGNKFVGTR